MQKIVIWVYKSIHLYQKYNALPELPSRRELIESLRNDDGDGYKNVS